MHPTGACIRIAARVIRDRRNIGHIYLSVRASDRFTRARCARVLQLVITAWIGRTPHEKQRGRRGEEWRSIRKLSRPAEGWGGGSLRRPCLWENGGVDVRKCHVAGESPRREILVSHQTCERFFTRTDSYYISIYFKILEIIGIIKKIEFN